MSDASNNYTILLMLTQNKPRIWSEVLVFFCTYHCCYTQHHKHTVTIFVCTTTKTKLSFLTLRRITFSLRCVNNYNFKSFLIQLIKYKFNIQDTEWEHKLWLQRTPRPTNITMSVQVLNSALRKFRKVTSVVINNSVVSGSYSNAVGQRFWFCRINTACVRWKNVEKYK